MMDPIAMVLSRQLPCRPVRRQHAARVLQRVCPGARQRGVVLIIALLMLMDISLLAVGSIRNAASTESAVGNVRLTELATQAAEIALRHCESSVLETLTVAAGGTSAYASTFTVFHILPPASPPRWQNMAIWDSASPATYVLPLSLVNQGGMLVTYQRAPECMVEPLLVTPSDASVVKTTTSFVVTARGFGPEVAAADADRSRPVGTEVWLQSHIDLE